MNHFCLTLISLLLFSCSNTKSNSVYVMDSLVTDSISTVEVSQLNDEEIAEEIPDEPEGDSLIHAITAAIDEVSATREQEGEKYTMSARYNGYESGSESTWYFDSSLNLKYCNGSWDMEGTSGTYSYYFDGDDLVAYSSEDMYQEGGEVMLLHTAFTPTYGFTRSSSGEEETITYLYESTYNSQNASAKDEFSKLLNLIRENLDSA